MAIGNEAVFSRRPGRLKPRLRGMDLVRLGLERATTAAGALTVMTELLVRHGQGGPAGHRNKRFAYDNSFLIADPRQAFILETAGTQWVARAVTDGFAAISNGYRLHADWDRRGGGFTGGDFAARHGDRLLTWLAGARARRCAAEARLRAIADGQGPSFAALAALLRHHARGDGFRGGSNRDICMHGGGRWRPSRPSATTASMIAYLPPDGPPKVMLTGRMTPCIKPFRPARIPRLHHGPAQLNIRLCQKLRKPLTNRQGRRHRGMALGLFGQIQKIIHAGNKNMGKADAEIMLDILGL